MEEVRLSSAGLPVLVDEEVELSLIPKAALSTSGAPGSHLTVELHLTNRRLIAVYPPPMRATFCGFFFFFVALSFGVGFSMFLFADHATGSAWCLWHIFVATIEIQVWPKLWRCAGRLIAAPRQRSFFRNTGLKITLKDTQEKGMAWLSGATVKGNEEERWEAANEAKELDSRV